VALFGLVLLFPALRSSGPNFPFRATLVVEPIEAALQALFLLVLCRAVRLHPRLEHGAWRSLGRISYGIYMWHVSVLLLMQQWLDRGGAANLSPTAYRLALYLLTTAGTLAVAGLSFVLLERPLLRLKGRFERVATGAS